MLRRIFTALLLVFASVGILAFTTQQFNAADNITISDLNTSLSTVQWLDIQDVSLMPGESGEDMLTVSYNTRETDLVAYRAEMLEVFRRIGEEGTLTEEVALIPRIAMGPHGEGVEVVTATAGHVQAFAAGEMTRTDFLDMLTITPLEHHSREEQDPA